jgi:hypothetical protein
VRFDFGCSFAGDWLDCWTIAVENAFAPKELPALSTSQTVSSCEVFDDLALDGSIFPT